MRGSTEWQSTCGVLDQDNVPIGKLPLNSVGGRDLDAAWTGGQALSSRPMLTAEAKNLGLHLVHVCPGVLDAEQ